MILPNIILFVALWGPFAGSLWAWAESGAWS